MFFMHFMVQAFVFKSAQLTCISSAKLSVDGVISRPAYHRANSSTLCFLSNTIMPVEMRTTKQNNRTKITEQQTVKSRLSFL